MRDYKRNLWYWVLFPVRWCLAHLFMWKVKLMFMSYARHKAKQQRKKGSKD